MVDVLIKVKPGSYMPTKAHKDDAAFDLAVNENFVLPSKAITKVTTGLYLQIPEGYKGEVYSRSGLSSKGITVANSPGKIDSGYRGEILVLLRNETDQEVVISAGDRIAQLEINPVQTVNFILSNPTDFIVSDRGSNGFGSTGTR
jgi:dUTP pyrophosphatase